jgi:hypothetical protein
MEGCNLVSGIVMKKNTAINSLRINSPTVTAHSANFCPPSWPIPDDFPVVIDKNGVIISRFRDTVWNLTPWTGVTKTLNFGRTSRSGHGDGLDVANGRIFQDLVAWWMWGDNPVRTASTLVYRFDILKPLFVVCSQENIAATDLFRFPRVVEKIARRFKLCALKLLADIWLARKSLGFVILDESGLSTFARLAKERDSKQTPFIPPRIWQYQNLRLRECLDDYIKHKESIEKCYKFCLELYVKNCGGSFSGKTIPMERLPFHLTNFKTKPRLDCDYLGAFRNTADKYGITKLLERWVNLTDQTGIRALASYLNLIAEVGIIYIMDSSFMRSCEAELLRASCHSVEIDELGEEVHLIGGITTKTVNDPNARWIASPSVSVAMEALVSVANLHVAGVQYYPGLLVDEDVINDPYLLSCPYAPWSSSKLKSGLSRKQGASYEQVLKRWPKLLEKEKLKISKEDFEWATKMTSKIDERKIAIGKIWPLANHQLRRTGAVNMLGSNIVMESSIQYQLKHSSRLMTRYYCQNHYKLKSPLVDEVKGFFLQESILAVVRDFHSLDSENFISPYGEKRKAQILSPLSEKNEATLLRDARLGKLCCRRTFFGTCTKQGEPCPMGGISNVAICMGYEEKKPCQDVLLDKENVGQIKELLDTLQSRLLDAPEGSDLHAATLYNIESARRALDVIITS